MPQHAHGTITLEDLVEMTAAAELRETFTNATVHGDDELGDALRHIATELPAAVARTRFDASWQVASTTVEGTQDGETRTMIMNLTPVVSFRLLPTNPVAIGDSWTNHWNEPMQRKDRFGTGNVATQVRYTLREVIPCGARRCAVIVGEGEDTIPPQSGTTGTSRFHGEQQVDVTDVVPVSKTIETTTVFRGEHQGQQFEYKNVVTIRIERDEAIRASASRVRPAAAGSAGWR